MGLHCVGGAWRILGGLALFFLKWQTETWLGTFFWKINFHLLIYLFMLVFSAGRVGPHGNALVTFLCDLEDHRHKLTERMNE